MSWLTELARPEIRALRAYEHAAWEPGLIRLHANELPWRAHRDASAAGLNCYPEPHPYALTAALASFYGVPADMLLAGRGSDEGIDLLIRCYCRAERDAIVICPPTFGMYGVAARIQGAAVHEVPLRRDSGWDLDVRALTGALGGERGEPLQGESAHTVKLVFLCSPNNPTGNRLDSEAIVALARTLAGRALMVVDEAYVEFARAPSLVPRVAATPGLVVLRTLSKAHGLAGARCGVVIAHAEVIALLRKLIQPYAITQLSIEAVFQALQPDALERTRERIGMLTSERARVVAALQQLPQVRQVWDSDANFLLTQFADAGAAMARAHGAGVLLRDLRGASGLREAVRISIGSPEHNERLLSCLR
ncbi:MAG TPA: histidinol-phosphate transaminase [Steroidobacteraceae bacterium]|nr:histidinol-phosphate transaminase [Steroidobacteraceae bacterium]